MTSSHAKSNVMPVDRKKKKRRCVKKRASQRTATLLVTKRSMPSPHARSTAPQDCNAIDARTATDGILPRIRMKSSNFTLYRNILNWHFSQSQKNGVVFRIVVGGSFPFFGLIPKKLCKAGASNAPFSRHKKNGTGRNPFHFIVRPYTGSALLFLEGAHAGMKTPLPH